MEFCQTLAAVQASKSRWWHKPLAAFIVACLIMVNWVLAKLNPNKQPPTFEVAVAIAMLGGLFLVFSVSWLSRMAAPYSTVMVFHNRLFKTNGVRHREWRFKDISSFALYNCETFRVLVLKLPRGHQSLVGVPLKVDSAALEDFLASQGLLRDRAAPVNGLESQ
jgi:hypothetical protein